ncbi:MAG TPA: cytochrome c oxidase subunit 4 [Mycobacteriales bacterium]
MRFEAKMFVGIGLFLLLASAVYGWWSGEVAGTTCLVLAGGLGLLIGSYFAFVAKRIPSRPEDRDDAEVADGAGELGFFSPSSYWPLGLAAAAAFGAVALAFFQVWMMIIAFVMVVYTVAGLLFEYYIGQNSPQPEPAQQQS